MSESSDGSLITERILSPLDPSTKRVLRDE